MPENAMEQLEAIPPVSTPLLSTVPEVLSASGANHLARDLSKGSCVGELCQSGLAVQPEQLHQQSWHSRGSAPLSSGKNRAPSDYSIGTLPNCGSGATSVMCDLGKTNQHGKDLTKVCVDVCRA